MMLRSVGPWNELHRNEVVARDFAELIDLHDVAVHQVRGELRFVDEELEKLGSLRVMRMDDLERDALREAGGSELLRLVHRRHAALRDLVDEAEGAVVVELAMSIMRSALCVERSGEKDRSLAQSASDFK